MLRPRVEVVEERDTERQRTLGKIAYRGGYTPEVNDQHVASTRADLGLWLDTSDQTPEATVGEIIKRASEAKVD